MTISGIIDRKPHVVVVLGAICAQYIYRNIGVARLAPPRFESVACCIETRKLRFRRLTIVIVGFGRVPAVRGVYSVLLCLTLSPSDLVMQADRGSSTGW